MQRRPGMAKTRGPIPPGGNDATDGVHEPNDEDTHWIEQPPTLGPLVDGDPCIEEPTMESPCGGARKWNVTSTGEQ